MGDHDDKEVDSHLSKDSGKVSEDKLSAVKKQLTAMHLEAIRENDISCYLFHLKSKR